MASLFASPDIAALVAAFPPPLPTRNQPSLVRGNSENGLLNSATVLNRFRKLLETVPSRIRKSDLPHRLGIERTDWLLECYDGSPQIRWSRDGVSLIPDPAWNGLIEDLIARCDKSFIGIRSYAKAENVEDVSTEELDRLVESYSLEAVRPPSESPDANVYLASKAFVKKTKAEIQSSMDGARNEKLNISRMYKTIPAPVLKQLSEDISSNDHLQVSGDDILFVPATYYATQQERLRDEREARIQILLEKFEYDDFVQIDVPTQGLDSNDVEDICSRYVGLHADGETPAILDVNAAIKVVALPVLLARTIGELKEEATNIVSSTVDISIDTMDDETKSRLCSACSEPVFASILLTIPSYADKVTGTMGEAQLENEQKRHERFRDSFRRDILAPIQLYTSGVESINDAKLKSNLNDYVCMHFRDDVISTFFKSARADGLLGTERTKLRETDKFLERFAQAKTVEELVTAATKYARKIKLEVPNDEELAIVRRDILERKAFKEMPKMKRGSDVLQNLVWILLSDATSNSLRLPTTNGAVTTTSTPIDSTRPLGDRPALFMSPGKDTGRMIKQYSTVAPEDTAASKRLGLWRDKLKSASNTDDDLEEMRELAKKVVGELFVDNNLLADVSDEAAIA